MRHKHLSALETLYKTTLNPSITFDEKMDTMLTMVRDVFGLTLGILSHIEDNVYTVKYIVGPEGAPPPGTTFDLEGTYCIHTLAANGPKSFHSVGQSAIKDHPCYQNFQLEAYIGAPIFVDNVRYGTLNFSAPDARNEAFSDDDHALINLCAQWIGGEIDRRESRERLLQQKTLFESMFQSVPDAVIISSVERTIDLINPAFTRMFGYALDEVRSQPLSMLYADPDEGNAQGALQTPTSAFSPYRTHYKHKDGHTFWGEAIGAPLHDAQGQLLGYLESGRDITDKLQAQAAKHEFVSVVSHELRTPLTSISGSLELIRSGVAGQVDDNAATLIGIACRNSQRLVRLINDILDVEKIQSHKMHYNLESIDLKTVLQQSIDEMTGYSDEFGVHLVKVDGDEPVTVTADRDRLLQVMANLISNGVKVSKPGDNVEVGIVKNRRQKRIFVRDFGPGIPQDACDDIFERFTQVDSTTTRKIGGTGLGLSISRTLVVQMGGQISFETEDGVGTTFYLDLPS